MANKDIDIEMKPVKQPDHGIDIPTVGGGGVTGSAIRQSDLNVPAGTVDRKGPIIGQKWNEKTKKLEPDYGPAQKADPGGRTWEAMKQKEDKAKEAAKTSGNVAAGTGPNVPAKQNPPTK